LSFAPHEASRTPTIYRLGKPAAGARTHLAIRVNGDPLAFAPQLRAVAAVDPGLRLYDVMPLADLGANELVVVRVMLRVLAVLGGIALVLATAGVYALMSFTVSRRTREIGIRIALGADRRRVATGVLSRAMLQVGLGVLAGVVPGTALVAFGAPEIANGAGTAAGVAAGFALAVFMLLIGACASAVPLRRALGVQPTDALRVE
jgi:putative ABC transport system permease protein